MCCTAKCVACRYYGSRFRQHSSWSELEAAERREDADLLGAIGLVRKYKQRTEQLVEAIKAAKVSHRHNASMHKAIGAEYKQRTEQLVEAIKAAQVRQVEGATAS
jgi:hypothetical protein